MRNNQQVLKHKWSNGEQRRKLSFKPQMKINYSIKKINNKSLKKRNRQRKCLFSSRHNLGEEYRLLKRGIIIKIIGINKELMSCRNKRNNGGTWSKIFAALLCWISR